MWYCFNKMYDGTCEAEFDEAWRQGGEHNDVGTIRARVSEAHSICPSTSSLGTSSRLPTPHISAHR